MNEKGTITINKILIKDLKEHCDHKGFKIGRVVENIVTEYLKKQTKKNEQK